MALLEKTFKPAPEELARANFYGLLARLFYAPPDARLLERLAGAEILAGDERVMPDAWQALVWAAARADVDAVHEAYDSAFVGTRKSRRSLYATAYMLRSSGEARLVALRADLAEFGLARYARSHEPVDHIAGLCDVMRHLIEPHVLPARSLTSSDALSKWPLRKRRGGSDRGTSRTRVFLQTRTTSGALR